MMHEEDGPADAATSVSAASASHSRIVHAPLPWSQARLRIWLFALLLGGVMYMMISAALPIVERIVAGLTFMVTGAIGSCIAGLVVHGRYRVRISEQLPRIETEQIVHDPAISTLVTHMLCSRGIWQRMSGTVWDWHEFAALFEAEPSRAVHRPICIVDSLVAQRLDTIDRPSYGLEPEGILGSGADSRVRTMLFPATLLFFSVISVFIWKTYLFAGVLFVAGLYFLVVLHPALRDYFRILRWDDGDLIAGMGAVRDRHHNLWTVENAVMHIHTKEGASGLMVVFDGEPGHLSLTFVDERDPDFIKLWQRWTHPQPRPELLAELPSQ